MGSFEWTNTLVVKVMYGVILPIYIVVLIISRCKDPYLPVELMECNTFGLFRDSFDTLQFLKSSMVWKNIVETNLLYHNKSSIESNWNLNVVFPAMPLKYIKQNSPNVDMIFVCRFLFLLCAYMKNTIHHVFSQVGEWFNFIFLLSSLPMLGVLAPWFPLPKPQK